MHHHFVFSLTLLLLLPSLVLAESSQCEQGHVLAASQSESAIDEILKVTADTYILMAEKAFSYRSQTIAVARKMRHRLEATPEQPLSGAELQTLKEGSAILLELREQLYEIAERYECWQDNSSQAQKLADRQRLKGLMISLSAALILYDNYLLSVSIFADSDKLRRLLNAEDAGYMLDDDKLEEMGNRYTSVFYRQRVRNAITAYENLSAKYEGAINSDEQMDYLQQIISQSPSYNMVREYQPLYYLTNKLEFLSRLSRDKLDRFKSEGINLFSSLFGNTVGMVEVRHGKLFGDKELERYLRKKLKAGDILLEKTPFRLTDKLIPGHWGHVAIWSGTKAELQSLGIWDHPSIKPHQAQIEQGSHVIEALRSGIEINPLSQFMNIDDMAIIRPVRLSHEQLGQSVIRAFQQIGKAYDFNFDIETTDKIVCSELAYIVYTDIEWPTQSTLGRYTISPDHIANRALKAESLELVYLNLDGKTIWRRPTKRLRDIMAQAN